jgi:spermidine/putrescine transport system ATP-binding protein
VQRVGLEIVGITKSYGDQPALLGVDLDVQAGEFFTLLGPSGCGKTTLLRIVAGLEQPDSGHINIGDREVTHEPAHTRRVNTVFQSYALFPHLNVADNVGFGLRMLGVNKAERQRRVAEMLEFMHIAALAERRAEQLSGGQQQRVALARALVNEPDILLLDEPLSALDAKLRGDLQLELKRTQRRLGTTFILVTHDQHEALTLSDRIAVMHEGRVEQIGAPAELYETPRTPYVADFLGLSNCLKVLSADGRKVETPVGSLQLTSEGAVGAQLMIRPERLKLEPEPRPEYNHFDATVRERIYLGSSIRYTLDIAGQSMSAIVAHEGHGRPLPEEGEWVLAQVHPSDVVQLAAE